MMLEGTILLSIVYVSMVTGQGTAVPPSNQVCLIVPQDVEQCYRNFQGKPIDDKAAQVNCLQKLLWNFIPDINNTAAEIGYFRSLAGDTVAYKASSILRNGNPRPPTGRRARQEYRTLTQQERDRFHRALNKLYEDGTLSAFARLYARAFESHHNGPSYLPWHRVFLLLFEEALRRIDPKVALPFWDSTMDNDMDNPVNSDIWTPSYFGNGIGVVKTGPAANWVTDRGNLERNYGQASRLLSKDHIRSILSKCELQDISQPTADIGYDFELYSGGVNNWVGGDIASPATSAYDPIFYMHHAFIDYAWELFRRQQHRRCGIDATQDYPNVPAGNSHAPESPMVGFEWLNNADGLKHYWVDNWYYYESTPACPNCCRGCPYPAPISCDRRRRVCVARSRRTFGFDRRTPNLSPVKAFAQANLDREEIEALSVPSPPINRGVNYQHPPHDGRTIHTAISDAFSAANQERLASQQQQGRSSERSVSDRRGSQRTQSSRSTRRGIPDGWGPPPERSSSVRRTSGDRRGFSSDRQLTPAHSTLSETDRRTGSAVRSLSSDRRINPDPRGSSQERRTFAEPQRLQTERRVFADGRGSVQDRRFIQDGQSSRHPESGSLSSDRARIAAFTDTRNSRRSGSASDASIGQRTTSAESRIHPPGGRLSPPQNLLSPELRAFSTQGKTILDMRNVKAAQRSPRNRGRLFNAPR